ncbi:DUF4397 domain-containing protein [Anaerovorax sp. IOR16]|uniref:DUF4397 domain-containing protein n=1 Tax=Anaerovorax sp. IOR16 TaxID=2773458 RepID=UPI0019D1323D|nr:DUF4397 domain-containing protein [Anaerovorax sp. IOR16]
MNVKKTKVYFNLGYFRIFHTMPGVPSVDIYVDDKLVAEDLAYSTYTAYLPMLRENYKVSIYEAGTNNLLLTRIIAIAEGEKITLALAESEVGGINFLIIPDAQVIIDPTKSMIRFIHLSPNAPAVDITFPEGTVIFRNVEYRQITPYLSVDPGTYNLQVRLAGTSDVVLEVPEIKLDPDNYYTIYAIGLVDGEPPLEAMFLLDSFK